MARELELKISFAQMDVVMVLVKKKRRPFVQALHLLQHSCLRGEKLSTHVQEQMLNHILLLLEKPKLKKLLVLFQLQLVAL